MSDPAAIERHLEHVRALAKPGGPLTRDSERATINNPAWFGRTPDGDLRVLGERRALHRELLDEFFAGFPEAERRSRAIVLAGPPGAGKSTTLEAQEGADLPKFVRIDADDFKKMLLTRAQADGTYESWLKPPAIAELEAAGERFFPLELASLVHEESSMLADLARSRAIREGWNLVADTVLSSPTSAQKLARQLTEAGYVVRVVDVEVDYELSERNIRYRWELSYREALEGKEGALGGRWVPSEYARDVFSGPAGVSSSEINAERLARECGVVVAFQRHRATIDMVTPEKFFPDPVLELNLKRDKPGADLLPANESDVKRRLEATRPPRRQRGSGPDGPELGR